jgi:GTP cyclohydrolase IA
LSDTSAIKKGGLKIMNYVLQQDSLAGSKLFVPDDVKEAIRTLIRWSSDDPDREGLIETPARVGRAWREYCQGYAEVVLVKDIPFRSHS